MDPWHKPIFFYFTAPGATIWFNSNKTKKRSESRGSKQQIMTFVLYEKKSSLYRRSPVLYSDIHYTDDDDDDD